MGCQGCNRRKQKIKAFVQFAPMNPFATHKTERGGLGAEVDNRVQFLDGNRLLIGRDVSYRLRMQLIDRYGGTYTIVNDPDSRS